MIIELLFWRNRVGVHQVTNFTSVDLVRLATGYPRLPNGNGNATYVKCRFIELLLLLFICSFYVRILF